MSDTARSVAVATSLLQQVATCLLVLLTVGALATTGAAAIGAIPWVELPLAIGGEVVEGAGMFAQLGLTGLLLVLTGFLPSNARVRRLELTNRDFHISMEDVARAYDHVHRADREGAFQLSREFDAMRDRIDRMRQHPDLAHLETDILQVAAQMSVEAQDLASVYSDERVERARDFLRQRQQEVEDYRQRISMAEATVEELRRWAQAVSVEEGLAETQVERLQKDLAEAMEAIKATGDDRPGNVVGMTRRDGPSGAVATPAE
jgi:TolA-binding protein